MHYTVKGEGRPLLLIHGFPNDGSAWNSIVPALSHHFRLIIPDLPGAGQSSLPVSELSLPFIAEGIVQILAREGLGKVLVAGHSMGGYVAMELASAYPGHIAGISLIHSLASADNDVKKENRKKAIALMRKGEAEKKMFLKGMAQNLFSKQYARRHPEALQQIEDNGSRLPVETLAAFYTAIMNRGDKVQLLEQCTFPIQWIIGDEDTATPMADALRQCSLASINDVQIYSPCGHMSFMEMPDRLIDDIVQFARYCLF